MADDAEWTPKQDMSLLCRVCANQHDYLIPIFQGEGLDHDMPTKMDKHLPIKVRESDKLPTQMCYQCASTIIAWSELHTNCLAADKKLKGMLRINEKKMGVVDTADDDAGSDHYEDAYDDGGGGGDDDDEDFEKEIKQLISDAGVELGSKTAKASKRPSRAAATRKRKSEVTITPVKRETKKPKTEPSASKSSTALLKPKEEVVSNEDRLQIWSCCVCSATFMSCESLSKHVSEHQNGNLKLPSNVNNDDKMDIKRSIDSCSECHNMFVSHSSLVNGNMFECAHCKQTFPLKEHLEYHIKIEHGRLLYNISNLVWYACKECYNVLYKREQDIVKHMEKFHFATNIDVAHFIVKTIEDVTFPCEFCGQNCVLTKCCTELCRKRVTKARVSHTDICKQHPGSHECQVCKLMCDNCEDLWSHMFKSHSENDVGFKCNICTTSDDGITFRHAPVIMYHMKMEHEVKLFLTSEISELRKRTRLSVDGVIKYKCVECSVVVTRFTSLKNHMYIHNNISIEKPPIGKVFVCELCKKRFPSKRNLNLHHLAVHEKRRPHKCDICGRGFSDKNNLNSHVRIHTGERKFVCEVCGSAFVQSSSLRYHMYCHSDKRLVCSHCGKTFKNPNHLRSHMNIHTGKRIYVCEVCGKEFRVREIWKGHMIVHSTARPFICEICNAGYKTKKHLVQHYKTHMKNSFDPVI